MITNAQRKNIEAIIEMLQSGQINLTNHAHVMLHNGVPIRFTVIGILLREIGLAPNQIAATNVNRGDVEEFPLRWILAMEKWFGMDKGTLSKLCWVNDFCLDSKRIECVCEALRRIASNHGFAGFEPDVLLVELNAADFDC